MTTRVLRNACWNFWEEIGELLFVYGCGGIVILWITASFVLLPIGLGLYFVKGFQENGTIILIAWAVCFFVLCFFSTECFLVACFLVVCFLVAI